MSGNQNRRSGRGGHQRGGYSGGGGSGAKVGGVAAAQSQGGGSSSAQPSLNNNRSFNKKGNGSFRQNPSSALSDANSGFAPATPPKGATPNGSQSHFQPAPQGPTNNATQSSVAVSEKATNMPPPRNPSLPRGPPQSAPKVPEPSMPPKGDQSKGQLSVPLQFGTINMGMMNGMPIPARTSSAPPNMDEQKRNQAMLDAMKGASQAPHAPLPSGPKPQIPQPRKEPIGTNTNINTGTVPVPLPPQSQPLPPQLKREIHLPAPPIPVSVPVSIPIQVQPPLPSIPAQPPQMQIPYQHQIPVPFQHQQPPQLQYGAHNPQMNPNSLQMPMNLPVGSAPQNIFVQGFNPQQQAMLHQSQNMGFAPAPPGHQMGPPQLGSLGLGPQYQPQQQSNKFTGVRKTTTVKITHPDTHEEVKLDNVTHRSNIMSGHSGPGPMQNFPPHMGGYYPVQAGQYNPQMFFANSGNMNMPMTNNQMPGGPQAPRFPYPVNQAGQHMNFMQQQGGNKPVQVGPSISHGVHSEGGNVETVLATGTNRPAVTITNPGVKVSITKPSESKKESKPVSETGTKAVTVGTDKQTGTAPLVLKSSVQAPAVLAAVEEKKKETVNKENEKKHSNKEENKVPEQEKPKLEEPVPVIEEAKQTQTVVAPVEEEKSNGPNKAPVPSKPDSTIHSKPGKEEKPAEIEEKSEKTQQEEKSPKIEAEPEKPQEEEKPVKTEEEKKTDEVPDKVIEKESEKPVLEVLKAVVETEEEKKRPNSSASSISTDSESVSSGSSSLINGNSSKPESKPKGISSNNNKPVVEVPKRPASSKKKKKIKEILSKADAAGSSDLYNAYKGPEEKSVENSTVTIPADVSEIPSPTDDVSEIPSPTEEESGANKGELEDWEDVAEDSTPKLPEIPAKKKYSRDFILTMMHQFTDLPAGFQYDTGDALMSSAGNTRGFDQPYPSPGRGNRGGERRLGNSSSFNEADKWTKSPGPYTPGREQNYININPPTPNLMNLRPGPNNYGVVKYPRSGQPSNQFIGGGILSPMPAGGPSRTGSDMDRWQHTQRGLIPSPVASPHQVMHKAESKYVVGKISDEEQAKQRQLKGILNKLTPQNFEKLFEQVKEVNIDNPITLSGVISQIFDKALMEPTFCEMYATFCAKLATALPDFTDGKEKITFKRLLLNKCQEEFERGEREEAEAEAEAAGKSEDEGEVKQTPAEREEKRLKARRRMLGNIRLIGELYKKKMLTERIMHECIKKLLGPNQDPDEEDIESLCKLMSTIGEMIDQPRAKEHLDVYFGVISKLSNNKRYSSRVRFMLKDTIDLRKNRWQQRRKVEGPKKIEDVHRDAANERQAQTTRLTRGPIINNPPRRTGTSLVSPISQQQTGINRGMTPNRNQDIRYDERQSDRYQFDNNRNVNVSLPLPQRVNREEPLTLGPQGGLGRGMSIRGQQQQPTISSGPNGSNGSEWNSGFGSRLASPDERTGPALGSAGGWSSARNLERNFSTGTNRTVPVPSPQAVPAISAPIGLPDNVVKEKSISAIREYVSAKDEKEVRLCIEEMNSPGSFHLIISAWINYSFERKNVEREMMFNLLIKLSKPTEGLFDPPQLLQGFEIVLSTLEDIIPDAPKAAEYLGELFAKCITEGFTSLAEIGRIILQSGEEPGMLIEAGTGGDLVGCTLESIKKEKGEAFLNEVREGSGVNLEEFRPPGGMRSKVLDLFL